MRDDVGVTPPRRSTSVRLRRRKDVAKSEFLRSRRSGDWGEVSEGGVAETSTDKIYVLLLVVDKTSPEPITIGRTLGESYGIFKHLVFPARFLGRCVCLYQGDGTLGETK